MEKILAFGIIRILLLFTGTFFLLNSIIYSFVISRLAIGSVIQIIISVCVIVYAFLFPCISNSVHIITGVVCLIPVLIIIFLMIYGNTGSPDYDEDIVIVMGAGVIGERITLQLAYRLDRAVDYLEKNEKALVVVCGGLGDRATITEAEAMKRYLTDRGIEPERIIKEDKSTSSYTNLLYAKIILEDYFPDGFTAVLITSDYHIFRTKHIASHLGINANRLGARTPLISVPAGYLRELLSIAYVLIFPPWR